MTFADLEVAAEMLVDMDSKYQKAINAIAKHSRRDNDVDLVNNPGQVCFIVKMGTEVVGICAYRANSRLQMMFNTSATATWWMTILYTSVIEDAPKP